MTLFNRTGRNYVVMDDNRSPYQIASFDRMPDWDTSQVSTFAVPLRRGVFLEAGDAAAIAETIFRNENLGVAELLCNSGAQAEQDNPFVLRLFLAASSSYREFRAGHSKEASSAAFYGSLRLPEYIWCAEISTLRQFHENRVLGEIVIDAKTSRNSYLDSLILVRCLDHIGFRTPDEDAIRAIDTGLKRRVPGLTHPFAMYDNNLKWCGGDDDV